MERIVIQSSEDNIIEVEKFISVFCDTYNINNYAGSISISLIQAVKNAIIHGNKNDSAKSVVIVGDKCKGGVFFTISDQGEGFDYEKVNCDLSDQCKGIFLMHSLSDKVTFLDGGSTVRLDFVINGIDPSCALERIATLHRYYSPKLVNA